MPLDPHKIPLHRNRSGAREKKPQSCAIKYLLLAATAPRTAGEMQNTQQTYGTVDAAAVEVAAAPPKKLGRKVVVVAAALSLAGVAPFRDERGLGQPHHPIDR